MVELYRETEQQMDLEPHPALDTMLETLMGKPYNQTEVSIGIEHWQQTETGDYVKIDGSVDMDQDTLDQIMSGFSAKKNR